MSQASQDIINDCIKTLGSFTPGADDFIDQVCELAASKSKQFSTREDLFLNMRTLADVFARHLPIRAGASTLDFIRIFERLFGAEGPLNGRQIDYYDPLPANATFIAAMHYLNQADADIINLSQQHKIRQQVTEIALAAGKHWDALRAQLELIDQERPQARLVEGIADLLQNLDFRTDKEAVLIQKAGGVERLKEIGADVDKICQAVLKNIHKTSVAHLGLPLVNRFIMDACAELLASGKITREESNERQCWMLTVVLNTRRNQKKDVHACYHEMMLELAPHMSKKHASDLIPCLSKYLSLDELKSHLKDPLSLIDLPKFQKGLTKHADAGIQYDLVVKLGLDGLFKPSQLQKFKGAKLESALGL